MADAPPHAHAPQAPPPVSRWLIALLRPVHSLFIPLWFRIKVRHRDRIPKRGPIILTPTHRSRWDPMLMPYLTRRLLRSMASQDEFVGIQGWFMEHLGAFPVDTRRPSAETIRACDAVLWSDQVLVIYPEGNIYRYPHGKVHPIKPGTAWIALKAQNDLGDAPLKIIPIRISYSDPMPKFRTRVEVEIREPIAVADFLDRPDRVAIRDITAAIQASMGEVHVPEPEPVAEAPEPALEVQGAPQSGGAGSSTV